MAYKQLPPCDGPKLHQFPDQDASIKWIRRIDQRVELSPDELDDDEEIGSYVFEAEIRGKPYAVKVFRFFNPLSSKQYWGPLAGPNFPLDQAAYYTDPFFNECRAYGRIKETARKKKPSMAFVIPCHGFLLLGPDEQRKILRLDPTVDFGEDEVDPVLQRKLTGGMDVRAIVKDLASDDPGVTSRTIPRIFQGLKNLNSVGIFNCDVALRNFRDGKAVDFGSSWTEPHKIKGNFGEKFYNKAKLADMSKFDQMVKVEGFQTKCVGIRHSGDYRQRLRSRTDKATNDSGHG